MLWKPSNKKNMPQDKTKDLAYVNDFQTPPLVADYMASLLPDGVKTVLEPTPGIGQLVAALWLYDVYSPPCYWQMDRTLRFDAVVSNLPFSSRTFLNCPPEWIDKGMRVAYHAMGELMEMSDNLVMLMPWFTISDSDIRLRKIKQFGLISVTALPRKTFDYARIQTCVLQMQKKLHRAD